MVKDIYSRKLIVNEVHEAESSTHACHCTRLLAGADGLQAGSAALGQRQRDEWIEPVGDDARLGPGALVDCLENLNHRALDDSGLQRGDAQRALSPIRLAEQAAPRATNRQAQPKAHQSKSIRRQPSLMENPGRFSWVQRRRAQATSGQGNAPRSTHQSSRTCLRPLCRRDLSTATQSQQSLPR